MPEPPPPLHALFAATTAGPHPRVSVPAPPRPVPPPSPSRAPLRALLAASLIGPALVLGGSGYVSLRNAFDLARSRLVNADAVASENATKVLDTHQLVLDQLNDLLDDYTDAQIVARKTYLRRRLAAAVDQMPQVLNVLAFDREGNLLFGLRDAPQANVADSDTFRIIRSGSPMHIARFPRDPNGLAPHVSLSHPFLRGAAFAGVLTVVGGAAYFAHVWANEEHVVRYGGIEVLRRDDGLLLAHYPSQVPSAYVVSDAASAAFYEAVRGGRTSGLYEGRSAATGRRFLSAFHRLDSGQAYTVAAIPVSAIYAAWGEAVLPQALLGAAAMLGLLLLAAVAYRRENAWRAAYGAYKEQARAAAEAQEYMRMMIDSVVDYSIYMLDANGRIATWNAGAHRTKGYAAEEVIGQHLSLFYTPEDRAAGVAEAALRTAAEVGKVEMEGWRVRKDGRRLWVFAVIDAVRQEDGTLIGFAKITRDITEQRRARAELEETNERLAQSERLEALGRLTGGIAHDFNNLLMVVSGAVTMAQMRSGGDISKYLSAAQQAVDRGALLTRQLLAFSRRQSLRPALHPASHVLRGALLLIGNALNQRIAFTEDIQDKLPWVKVDAAELQLALLNVAINAQDAMPEGGSLTVRARVRRLDGLAELHGEFVMVEVADTGTGIAPENLDKVLWPYFTTKGVGKGSGLGLPQAHGFCMQSGGALEVASVLGEGTTIRFYIPVAPAPAEPVAPAPAERPGLAPC